jgi:transcriptional regulator with XRE-family HTH domain
MSRRRTPENLQLQPTYFREWRIVKGKTLQDMAKVMGIDATAISRLERGRTPYDQIHL